MKLTDDQSAHIALVETAKKHLGMVAPDFRGQLARYLDLGEEPRDPMLIGMLDSSLGDSFYLRAGELATVFAWLAHHAPKECWGTRESRLAWQAHVSAIATQVADEDGVELRDTERPAAIELGTIEDERAAE